MTMGTDDGRRPECPRCGYDLSGEVAVWTASCPLAGRCSECGISLDWSRVMAVAEHPWLFEYHWRHQPLRRLVRTWLEAFCPRRFWRDVRLTDPVRLRPLLTLIGSAGLVAFVALVANIIISVLQNPWSFRGSARWQPGPMLIFHAAWDVVTVVMINVPGPVFTLVLMPLAFVMLPQTLRRARVRQAHVLRIWMYSMFAPLTVGVVWTLAILCGTIFSLDWLNNATDPGIWVRGSRLFPTRSFWAVHRNVIPGLLMVLSFVPWLAVWWWRACRFYLELPRSGWIAVTLSAVVGLAAVTVQWWVHLGWVT